MPCVATKRPQFDGRRGVSLHAVSTVTRAVSARPCILDFEYEGYIRFQTPARS